jgi:hypothetical protein
MGNALLDFVMSLVRDPQAAARYAADPAGTLSAAGLPEVTITDVQNLIPMVTDSLAMTTPSFGAAVHAADVWTSGAATAALDAFHVPHPEVPHPEVPHPERVSHESSPQMDTGLLGASPAAPPAEAVPYPVGQPAANLPPIPDLPAAGPLDHPSPDSAEDLAGWHQAPDFRSDHHPMDHPGFGLI